MDSITQAALGAVVGGLVLGRRLGRSAVGWGALIGIAPDLDAVLLPFLDTAWDLRIHRSFSHSAILAVVLAFVLAGPLSRRWKKQRVTPRLAGGFVFVALAVHILADCLDPVGTQVWWPISSRPVSFDALSGIDPLFSLPLLVAVVRALWVRPKEWKKGVGIRFVTVCAALSVLYVGAGFWAKHAVGSAMERDLEARGLGFDRMMQAPAPVGILLWRGLAERGDEIWVTYRSIFDGSSPAAWTIYPKSEETLDRWNEQFDVREIRRFSQDWCLARPTPKGVWLVDLRFGEYREWDKRGTALRPLDHAWEFQREGRGDPLKRSDREARETKRMFGEMWARAWGGDEGWSDRPRLIGNPAVPQEYLGTVR